MCLGLEESGREYNPNDKAFDLVDEDSKPTVNLPKFQFANRDKREINNLEKSQLTVCVYFSVNI